MTGTQSDAPPLFEAQFIRSSFVIASWCYAVAMLTVVAAMREEISIALAQCEHAKPLSLNGLAVWEATCQGVVLHLLRTGIGPSRAAARFARYLAAYRPSRVLLAGYGGALDPVLKVGDVVAVRQVSLLDMGGGKGSMLQRVVVKGKWLLDGAENLALSAEAAGLRVLTGDGVTSAHMVGEPAMKSVLHARFRAAVIDMESAVVAAAASSAGIAVSCLRAISDEAAQDFLAPFSYEPGRSAVMRAARVVVAGRWANRYRTWRACSEKARRSLSSFLAEYLSRRLQEAVVTPSPRSD